ncbi:TRAP transporter large permease [Novispirillum itersonii]|uniref:TRAP transporter large permease protein n=1 Tax=Novispirillum itersonii TaxID=189 RepID=A0A7X0DMU5_NOVIT|nr:TRAP transporter large permease [Novispirillum itersonii]MBB6211335.1 tripartite ATP-independent transporter DctM subunit [Novispirillum itersonii]
MGLTILLGLFALCTVIGVPVAYGIGIAAVAAFAYEGLPMLVAFQRIMAGSSIFALLAIPFFIFAGELMLHGGIAVRLIRLASSTVGWIRGGLGQVTVFSSMLFGGISGSAVADTSAIGSLMIPMMKKKGYGDDYAVNVTVTSSIAGILIPPSHNMVLYVVAAGGGISVSKLFLAGVVPGILMCLALSVAARWVAVRKQYPTEKFEGLPVIIGSLFAALPGLFTAVIIVGGTLSGVFTVTESGAFGVIYALIVTLLVYRKLTWHAFTAAVKASVRVTAMVMILVACASAFGYMLALYQVPQHLTSLVYAVSANPVIVLLMINIILLVLGMVMDMAALILICTPIFLPVAVAVGMDPIQFGVMLMLNLGLGLCTPPVGACLFVGCAIGSVPIHRTVQTIWPFYAAILVTLGLITYIPMVSLGLPALLGG